MKSARAKVLHRVAGRTMLAHVLACAGKAGAEAIAVVVGPGREDVAAEARAVFPGAEVFVQTERLGTAHAVLAARPALERACYDEILVLCADIPLVEPQTLLRLAAPIGKGAALAVLGFEAADPGKMFAELAQDSSEFAVWFRERVQEINGIDLTQPSEGGSEVALDWVA